MRIIKHGYITPKAKNNFRYNGWPTVITLSDGTLLAGWSGDRFKHICPFGRVMMSKSFDGGYSWITPYCVQDTPLDDRDAGLLQIGDKIMMTSVTNHRAMQRKYLDHWLHSPNTPEKKAFVAAYIDLISDEDEKKYLGPTVAVSCDGANSFSEPKLIPLTCPHGPLLTPDGRILHVGTWSSMYPEVYKRGIYMEELDIDGNLVGEPWLVAEAPEENVEWCEPHACLLPNGDILLAIRFQNKATSLQTIYLCRSADGGKTFSKAESTGWDGLPPHVYVTSKDAVVISYGCRHEPMGIRARVSYDNGYTFGEEIVLRDDGLDWDLGYATTTENAEGQLVTVYYMKDVDDVNENRIQYTIWEI